VTDDTQRVEVVLHIDEAHELKVPFGVFGRDINLEGRTRLDALWSVLDVFCKEFLFSLLISAQFLLCPSLCGGEPKEPEEKYRDQIHA
jgi:hypothetical protein